MLRVAELSLRKGSFDLILGRNGRQAVEIARRVKPDLIVMDVLMPEMDGLQALRQLKSRPDTAGIPVIMVTARGHVVTRQEAAECGADLFITKPFSPTQLLREAIRLTQQSRGDDEAAPAAPPSQEIARGPATTP
jgi:CheY-like chemotaxis protein